jgi:hypothetical protein
VSELDSIEKLFRGRHFDREMIILCVRWYLRYKLSFRDLVEMKPVGFILRNLARSQNSSRPHGRFPVAIQLRFSQRPARKILK